MKGLAIMLSPHSSRFECWFKFSNGYFRRLQGTLGDLRSQIQGHWVRDPKGSWERFRHMDQREGYYLSRGPNSTLERLDEIINQLE